MTAKKKWVLKEPVKEFGIVRNLEAGTIRLYYSGHDIEEIDVTNGVPDGCVVVPVEDLRADLTRSSNREWIDARQRLRALLPPEEPEPTPCDHSEVTQSRSRGPDDEETTFSLKCETCGRKASATSWEQLVEEWRS